MKNKEKFKNEIVDIVCNDDVIAVDKETRTPVACSSIDCDKCLFLVEFGCSDTLVAWANQEYKESFVISRKDRVFLDYIKEDYGYISRDKNGCLYAYFIKPKKCKSNSNWIGDAPAHICKFNIVFPMVKWSDEQPWKISDLKKLKIVEKY